MLNIKDILTIIYRAYLSPTKSIKSYSQCGEDVVLRYLLSNIKSSGFYVDVGCHHPRRGSNTYYFYKHKGWHGILIDLEPTKIYACKLLRWRDKCILAAVNDKSEVVTIFSPKKFSVLTTINPNATTNSFKPIGTITLRTLTEILDTSKAPSKFELLSIDVEGVDLQVLKGLDFNKYQPEFICIEVWEAADGLNALLSSEINKLLNNRSYTIVSWAGKSMIYQRTTLLKT